MVYIKIYIYVKKSTTQKFIIWFVPWPSFLFFFLEYFTSTRRSTKFCRWVYMYYLHDVIIKQTPGWVKCKIEFFLYMYTLYLKSSRSVGLKLHFCINQYPKSVNTGGKGGRLLDLVHVNNILMINFARRGELSFRVSPCTSYGSWCGDAYFQRSQIITHLTTAWIHKFIWANIEYISSFVILIFITAWRQK